jgi:hypothetical protein
VREEQRATFELRHTIAAGTETLDPDLNLPAAARACLASHVAGSLVCPSQVSLESESPPRGG